MDCNHPVDVSLLSGGMSRLSRGHSVQSMWIGREIRSGRPGCFWDSPPSHPGDTSEADYQISFCGFVNRFFWAGSSDIFKGGGGGQRRGGISLESEEKRGEKRGGERRG